MMEEDPVINLTNRSLIERLSDNILIQWCKLLEPIGVLIALIAFCISLYALANEYQDRKQERIFRAVSLLGASTGGSAGKPEALSYLIKNGVSLNGLKLGDANPLSAPEFDGISLVGQRVVNANLENVAFYKSDFSGAFFGAVNANGISMDGRFERTSIWMSDFSNASIGVGAKKSIEAQSIIFDHGYLHFDVRSKTNLFPDEDSQRYENKKEASLSLGLVAKMQSISARCAWIMVPLRNLLASDINVSGARFGYSPGELYIDDHATEYDEQEKINFDAWFYEDNPPINFPKGIPINIRKRSEVLLQCKTHDKRAFLDNPYGTLSGADGISPHCISIARSPDPCMNDRHYTGDPARTREFAETDPFENPDLWSSRQIQLNSIEDYIQPNSSGN